MRFLSFYHHPPEVRMGRVWSCHKRKRLQRIFYGKQEKVEMCFLFGIHPEEVVKLFSKAHMYPAMEREWMQRLQQVFLPDCSTSPPLRVRCQGKKTSGSISSSQTTFVGFSLFAWAFSTFPILRTEPDNMEHWLCPSAGHQRDGSTSHDSSG